VFDGRWEIGRRSRGGEAKLQLGWGQISKLNCWAKISKSKMAEKKLSQGSRRGGVAKMQFRKGQNSKFNYWAKILSAKWQRKICAGLPQGGSQNAIWEWPTQN